MSEHAQDVPDVNHVIKACEAMLARGDVEEALHRIEGALTVWPLHRTLRHRCATALRRLGRHAEAAPVLESLMQDGPFSPGVAAELATALKQVGEVDRAEVFCQQALDAQPDHEGAQAVLIEIALGRGDVAAALVRSEAAVKGRPESRLLRHRHATCLQRSGRHQAASTILEALHAEHPTHRAFSLQLASVSRQLGKMDRAEALYLEILDNSPDDEAAQAGLIEIALQRGEIDAALSRSEAALAERPKSRLLRHRHATCLRHSGAYDKAKGILEFLHGEAPENAAFALELAAVARQLGDTEKAELLYSKVLAVKPDHDHALAGQVALAQGRGDIDVALSLVKKALKARPKSRLLRHRYASCLRAAGRNKDARIVLQDLHLEAADHAQIATDLALCCQKLGDLHRAEALFKQVLSTRPKSATGLEGLISIAEARSDTRAIIFLLEKVLSRFPSKRAVKPSTPYASLNPVWALRLADLLIKVGENQRATETLRSLELHAEPLSEGELALFIRLADRLALDDLLPSLIDRVRSRDVVRLHLALTVFRLAIATQDPRLIETVKQELIGQIHPLDRLRFRAESTMLLRGPFEAMATLLAEPHRRRATRDAELLGRILLAAGRTRLALRYLRLCYRRWPNSPGIRSKLVSAFIANGRHKDALVWLETQADRIEQVEMDGLRLRILMETDAHEAALGIMERQLATGQRPAGSEHQLRMLIALGRLEEAEKVEAAARCSPSHSRSRAAHFGTSHAGALLTELRMYRHALPMVHTAEDRLALIETNYHAACEELRHHAGSTGAAWTGPPVPRRIVQYWNDPEPPAEITTVMRSWRNISGWAHLLYDRKGARRWLSETLGLDHARAFALARHAAAEADFLRLCSLFHGGGIYADADDMLVGRPEGVVGDRAGLGVFFEEYGAICNNLICAPPGHPVLGRAVGLVRDALFRRDNDNLWLKTGPGLLTRAVASHLAQGGGGVILRPQASMRVVVRAHVPMPYKQWAGYWNSVRKKGDAERAVRAFARLSESEALTV